MTVTLSLLCAGAAQGLVSQLAPRLRDELGVAVGGRFGAVGAMREAFDAGDPCDVMVSTDAIVAQMVAAGELLGDARAALGRVRTGVAVRAGSPHPDVSTPAALAAALQAADSIYVPDTVRSTAGLHFLRVLGDLGLQAALQARLRTYPNGATAMRELAAATTPQPIGCTQVTEILYTPGVELVAVLPPQFELATVYTAAVAARARHPDHARRLVALLAAADTAALRQGCGFEA